MALGDLQHLKARVLKQRPAILPTQAVLLRTRDVQGDTQSGFLFALRITNDCFERHQACRKGLRPQLPICFIGKEVFEFADVCRAAGGADQNAFEDLGASSVFKCLDHFARPGFRFRLAAKVMRKRGTYTIICTIHGGRDQKMKLVVS